MAAQSNGGDERTAQIGSAVTRPIAASTATGSDLSRTGQPDAARQRRHSR
jgi:hypothetical protein